MHIFKHLGVVLKHKFLVFRYCCKAGIPFRGLVHDTNKFGFTEFFLSAKYFDGKKSPTIIEREYKDGISDICLHHTGRNKHHWQYWLDFDKNQIIVARMPYKCCVEFVCDMLSASKTYNKKDFSFEIVLEYYLKRYNSYIMHPACKEFVRECFKGLINEGFKALKKGKTKSLYEKIIKEYDVTYFIPMTEEIFNVVKVR